MPAAVFIQRSVQVSASTYFGLVASSANTTLYTAGAVKYWVYTPSTAALATFGWTGLPYRVKVYWPTATSNLTGVGVNEGMNMTDNFGVFPRKLGFGTANDGSLALPVQDWPTLCVFPQFPNSWNAGNTQRGAWMVHDAVMQDVFANYNCDPNFIYGSGCSGGAGDLMEYMMAQVSWPTRYPVRYAAVTTIAGSFSGSGTRGDWPEAIQGENSNNQTFPRLSRIMLKGTTPWIDVHSTLDDQCVPAIYNSWSLMLDKYASRGIGNPIIPGGGQSAGTIKQHNKYLSFFEYSGVNAPKHSQIFASGGCIFDYFYGNNAIAGSGTMSPTDWWATWMFQQKLVKPPKRTAMSQVYSYDGGSGGSGNSANADYLNFRRKRQRWPR